jgi:dipeptidyl aminopeptidase/acylaminoacyl peptidase
MKVAGWLAVISLACAVAVAGVCVGAWASGSAAGSGLRERLLVVSSVLRSRRQVGHVYDGSGRLVHTLVSPEFASLSWSPNGRMAAIVSKNSVWVERANGGDRRLLVRIKTRCTTECTDLSVAWTSNGRRLAVGGTDPHTTGFELVDVATGRAMAIGKPHSFVFYSPIAFSPNGRWLEYGFSGGKAGTASCCVEELVVSRADGTKPRVLHDFGDPIHDGPEDSTWSPDSTRIAFTDDGRDPKDPRLAIVDVRSGRLHALNPHQIYDQYAAWSPNGRRLALAQYRGSVFTVATNGSGLRSLHAKAVGVVWLRDGDLLLARADVIDILPGGQGSPRTFIVLPGREQLDNFQEAR